MLIPVLRCIDESLIGGVEAVIDKDAASALLARQLGAGTPQRLDGHEGGCGSCVSR